MVVYATFTRRFWAFVLDCCFDLFVLAVLRAVGVGDWFGELWGAWLLIHHVGFVMEGGTLGHRLLGLRIVRSEDGARIDPVRAVLRLIIKISSLVPLGLGFLWMLDEPKRRTWHDLGARTVVVRELASTVDIAPDWAAAPPWQRTAEPVDAASPSVSDGPAAV